MKKKPTAKIKLQSISKSFVVNGKKKLVLDGISLDVKNGEFVSIVGPSGCGKTTLLNIIAGLEMEDKGSIKLNSIPMNKRLGRIGYMQQKDLLFPWRSVLDNAILGMEIKGISRSVARKKALGLVDTFGLKGFEDQYPFTLSGGMRQRAAFLRIVLLDQDIMLLDEPFGALDALTRMQMREWLLSLWKKFHNTIVFVTHDVDEAILASNKIYVLTARPAQLALTVDVKLPRPRNYKMVALPNFTKIKKQILTCLYKEI